MSSEIWQISQKMTASEMYDDVKENGYRGHFMLRGETFAVKQLTFACAKMIETYNEISEDQTAYLVELENESAALEDFRADVDTQIKKLMEEVKNLEQKKEDGSITEDEEAKLENKKIELAGLHDSSKAQIKTKTDDLTAGADERVKESRSKAKIAKDYGETTVEKGTPLAETEVKGGFFRKLFGTTGAGRKNVGESAVKVGNELLDKVSDSEELDTKIETQLNKYVKK